MPVEIRILTVLRYAMQEGSGVDSQADFIHVDAQVEERGCDGCWDCR